MNRPRSFEQRLEAWLEEGPASAPPDLLDEVLDSVPANTPQRRRPGAGRRLLVLSSFARFGAAIAAILVIGVVGIALLNSRIPAPGNVGAVGDSPTPLITDAPTTAASDVPTTGSSVPPTVAPTEVPVALCAPQTLAARVISWDGATGHRIATVQLKNTGSAACQTASMDRPQLVGGNGAILIDGTPAVAPSAITLAAGEIVTALVQDANYCGAATPVAPVTVAFVLSTGAGRIVAAPQTPTDDFGVPPCNGAMGSPGDIEMQPWAP